MFQSTHPHGVRQPVEATEPTISTFQSTHPHGVRLNRFIYRGQNIMCFNPRTRTGCDRDTSGTNTRMISFNPRTRTGCDKELWYKCKTNKVSIHAPARGATTGVYLKKPIHICFNPRTRTGCDRKEQMNKEVVLIVSIHAPARGATENNRIKMCIYICFNPRTRTGCDRNQTETTKECISFNPRTRTGCDQNE